LGCPALKFAFAGGPEGFDFNNSFRSRNIVSEAAPFPILGALDESAFYGVAVEVAEFFEMLGFAPDVEVVVALLPEMTFYRKFS